MADLGELVALRTRDLRALADLPRRAVIRIGGYNVVGVQVEGVSLQPEHPRLRRCRLPADDLRDPRTRVLGVLALLAQVGLPESVQQRLREPRDQRPAGLRRGAEDRLAELGPEKILPVQLRVAKVRIRIPVGEFETRQGTGQVGRKMRQLRKVEHEFRYRRRGAIPSQGLLEAVRLRRHVVDDDDRRWLGIVRRGPPSVLLVLSTFVNRRLDQAAGARERLQITVDADAVFERIVGAARQERCKVHPFRHSAFLHQRVGSGK